MKNTITTVIFFSILFLSMICNAQTYFSDNFENGLSKWIVGANNWDTLSTTYTSSNHCLTDSRIGNYTYNADPVITMSQTINLSATTFPVLTFFHRFNLMNCGGLDWAHLQISTNGGFNWTTIGSWANTNLAWTHFQCNLSAYKSNVTKIRFMLSSHNACGYTADGWYIDDVRILEFNTLYPTCSLPFIDNFENGMSNWRKGGFNWDTTSSFPNSGLRCATDSRVGDYLHSSEPTIAMSCVVDISNTTLPVLSFFHRYRLRDCGGLDRAYLQISSNGGFDWTTLDSWTHINLAWTQQQYNLSNFKSNRVAIRYFVSSYNACGYSEDGVYIDDFKIEESSPSAINLNLTMLMEGLYNPATDVMSREEKLRVYLRQASTPFALVDSVIGYVDPYGLSGMFTFNGVQTGTYYIVVKNICGLETWSQSGGEYLVQDNSTYEYDFTIDQCMAYGCNQKLKGTKWCIFSGDVTQDGVIDLQDVLQIRTAANMFTTGFFATDLNGDELTDLTDMLIAYNNSVAFVSVKRP